VNGSASTWSSCAAFSSTNTTRARSQATEEVASAPIPNTLVHGDLHADNIVVSEGSYLIFDWTDACIAHPFIDAATFLRYAERASIDQATCERWRDRYLRGWEELAPYEVTSRLFELVAPLAAMHQVITYRWLLDSLAPSERWQFGSALEELADESADRP
jgi:aminoglycoside phosphotransferase (APT) family kinase protein